MRLEEKLQLLRKRNGYSQEQLSDKIGIARQTISKWENGQAIPELNGLILLSELYGVTIDNPYVGCTHACKYCYARFMKRFSGHTEKWGDFIDIKTCEKPIDLHKIKGKTVFLSSVTDCYNGYEEKYGITRSILKQLVEAEAQITISTKSSLILRDIDLL